MSADFAVKPVHAPAPTEFVRPAPVAAREGVATDVSPERSVNPAEQTTAVRNDPNTTSPELSRQLAFDERTNALILRIVETQSQQVVNQIPSEAVLKLRAYNRALVAGLSANQAQQQTNRES